jgi:putrescine transport system substrate-binding protein
VSAFGYGFLIVTALLAAATARAEDEKVLNILNWADYIGPTTIADFEAEYGIEVNYDTYDSTEVVEARLLAGRTGLDVVIHAERYSARMIPIGVYQPLDRRRLPLWDNLDPWVLGVIEQYDPGNRHGMPYMWGSTGFAYNVRMIGERMPDAPVGSGDMIFKPEVARRFADCGISFLDEPTDVIPLAMRYLGHDANSLEPEHMAEVEALLKGVRPYVRYFSSAKLLIDLPNEEVCIAMSWAGDYAQAMRRAAEAGRTVELAYTVPREGSVAWFDSAYIPADAPHPDNAHLFLNYLLRPKVIAAISNETRYANANRLSGPWLWPEVRDDPAVYPPPAERDRLAAGVIMSPREERLRTRLWARVKTGL